MRTLIICFLLGWMTLTITSAQTDTTRSEIDTTTFVFANVMFDKGNYEQAAFIYEQLLKEKGPAAEVYYNLGNCYYKLNYTGKSVLMFERALTLDPSNDDIQYNLHLANLHIRDKIDPVNASIFNIIWKNFLYVFGQRTWTALSLLFLWISLCGFILYRFTKHYRLQQYGFYTAAVAFIIFVITITGAYGRNGFDAHHSYAVVMSPSAVVKSAPGETSTNLFLLHEGLKIQILRNDEGWSEIKMPDGHVGWIKDTDLEII